MVVTDGKNKLTYVMEKASLLTTSDGSGKMASTQLLAILKYLVRIVQPSALESVCSPFNCIRRQEIYVRKSHPNAKKRCLGKTDDVIETKKMPKKVLAKKRRTRMQNRMNPAKLVFGQV